MEENLKDALSDVANWHDMDGEDVQAKLLRDARDRIEALEKALSELSYGWDCCAVSKQMKQIARAALGEKKDV